MGMPPAVDIICQGFGLVMGIQVARDPGMFKSSSELGRRGLPCLPASESGGSRLEDWYLPYMVIEVLDTRVALKFSSTMIQMRLQARQV